MAEAVLAGSAPVVWLVGALHVAASMTDAVATSGQMTPVGSRMFGTGEPGLGNRVTARFDVAGRARPGAGTVHRWE